MAIPNMRKFSLESGRCFDLLRLFTSDHLIKLVLGDLSDAQFFRLLIFPCAGSRRIGQQEIRALGQRFLQPRVHGFQTVLQLIAVLKRCQLAGNNKGPAAERLQMLRITDKIQHSLSLFCGGLRLCLRRSAGAAVSRIAAICFSSPRSCTTSVTAARSFGAISFSQIIRYRSVGHAHAICARSAACALMYLRYFFPISSVQSR